MKLYTELFHAQSGEFIVEPQEVHQLQVIKSGQCKLSLFYSEKDPTNVKPHSGAYFYTPPHFPRYKAKWNNVGSTPIELVTFCFTDDDICKQKVKLPNTELLPADDIYDDLIVATMRNLSNLEDTEENKSYSLLLQNTLLFHLFRSNIQVYESLQENLKPMLELYINENINRKITIEELANFSGMSKSNFIRHFKESFTQTPLQYIKTTRMEKAAEIIENSNKNVSVIAYELGYQSASQFTEDFRKYSNHTPTKYREARLDKSPTIVIIE